MAMTSEKRTNSLQLPTTFMKSKIVIILAIISGIMGILCLCLGYIAADDTCCLASVLNEYGISKKHLLYCGERTEALFTLTGLLVVYAAFTAQHLAIAIQKEEMNRHAKIFENQLFSHNFQLLINGYNNMRCRIDFANQPQCEKCPSCGENIPNRRPPLMTILDEKAHQVMRFYIDTDDVSHEEAHTDNVVLQTYQMLSHLAAPYINSILHAFETIDKSTLTEHEKQFYASLFKSQLSISELVFLYHVPLFSRKKTEYKRLVRQE